MLQIYMILKKVFNFLIKNPIIIAFIIMTMMFFYMKSINHENQLLQEQLNTIRIENTKIREDLGFIMTTSRIKEEIVEQSQQNTKVIRDQVDSTLNQLNDRIQEIKTQPSSASDIAEQISAANLESIISLYCFNRSDSDYCKEHQK